MSRLFLVLLALVLAVAGAKAADVGNSVNCPPKPSKDPAPGKKTPGATNLLLCLPPKARPMTKAERDEAQQTDEWQREWAGVPEETWNKMTDTEKAQRKQDEWQRKWTGVPRDAWDKMTDAEKAKAFEKAKTARSGEAARPNGN